MTSDSPTYRRIIKQVTDIYLIDRTEPSAEEADMLPEKALIRAFLDRMIKDAIGLSVDVQRHYRRDARKWLMDGTTVAPFSLAWVCQALDKPVEKFVRIAERLNGMSKQQIIKLLQANLKNGHSSTLYRGIAFSNICRANRPPVTRRQLRNRLQGSPK